MASFCPSCGSAMEAGDRFCPVCGRDTTAAAGTGALSGPQIGAAGIWSTPAQTSGKAVASLVSGLLFFIPFAFLAAIVFGHIALSEIKKSAGRLKGEGMAIAGLVLGYLWIVSIPVMLILAAIAIPNFMRARMAANEASAVSGVHTLIAAEVSYAANHPDRGYTCSFSDLEGDRLISGELTRGSKVGYTLELRNCTPEGTSGANAKFQVVAYPITPNQTGRRAFCSIEDGVIKVDTEGSASGCLENGTALHQD